VQSYYQAALAANGTAYRVLGPRGRSVLPRSYLTAHKHGVWFAGNGIARSDHPVRG